MVRLIDILDKVRGYHPKADTELINRAYVYSQRKHEGQHRDEAERRQPSARGCACHSAQRAGRSSRSIASIHARRWRSVRARDTIGTAPECRSQ